MYIYIYQIEHSLYHNSFFDLIFLGSPQKDPKIDLQIPHIYPFHPIPRHPWGQRCGLFISAEAFPHHGRRNFKLCRMWLQIKTSHILGAACCEPL